MTMTLEAIEAKHSEVADMIAEFKRQASTTTISIAATTISLAAGEVYAGILFGDDGRPSHHLILLPGDADGRKWADAQSWAEEQGGMLPTRREQSLLFANAKSHFQKAYYWSSETHESDSAYAWCQYFGDGGQYGDRKADFNCRARAVRRLIIQ